MRGILPILFVVLIVALAVCAVLAIKSAKRIGGSVALLLFALIPPMIGNLLIIVSQDPNLSYAGCYIYFLGMNFAMFALLGFTFGYCRIKNKGRRWRWAAYALLILDSLQILLNLFDHKVFTLEPIIVNAEVYYRFVPLFRQYLHRIVDYGVFFAVLIIFLVKMIRASRLYIERYAVIFASMVVVGLWESWYIFSRTPVDRSMIGFGVFGLLVYFFSIYYQPMRLLDRMLVRMASELPDSVLFFDLNRNCIWANSKGLALLGVTRNDLEHIPQLLINLFGDAPEETGEDWTEQQCMEINGQQRYLFIQKKTVFDKKKRFSGTFLNIRDNTAEIEALQKERYSATHDATTGLYNREFLYHEIRRVLTEEPEKERVIVVGAIDEFEVVTDVYGSAFGELALRRIKEWLSCGMPEGSVYGSLGGTDFGACIPVSEFDPDFFEKTLSRCVIREENVEQHVFIHFGVYQITDPELEISIMFDRARIPLSTLRGNMKQYVSFYEEDLRDRILWNHQISAELPTALKDGQIVPYLQPIMDSNGILVGAEVLARWNHPTEGFLSPASFIPILEKNGLIVEMDRFMWRSACRILKNWKQEGRRLFLSVNISPKDFDVMDVEAELRSLVSEYEIDPSLLRLEITETVMGTDPEGRLKILNNMRKDGFLIEMDDFGSGYSSMNMLKDMPLDLVKLDMVFLQKSEDVEKAKMIVGTIIRLTRQLGILSLMEGVETDRQYHVLSDMGCQFFQGYYFSRPVPLEEFSENLK